MYEPPPPFTGTWEQMRSNTIGMVKKQQQQKPGHQKGLLLGPNSPFKSMPLLNLIL